MHNNLQTTRRLKWILREQKTCRREGLSRNHWTVNTYDVWKQLNRYFETHGLSFLSWAYLSFSIIFVMITYAGAFLCLRSIWAHHHSYVEPVFACFLWSLNRPTLWWFLKKSLAYESDCSNWLVIWSICEQRQHSCIAPVARGSIAIEVEFYVCMYVCIYVYTVFLYVCVHVCMYVCVCVCVCVCVFMFICVCICVCWHTETMMMNVCVYVCIHTHIMSTCARCISMYEHS
jgi:hypothetical protein